MTERRRAPRRTSRIGTGGVVLLSSLIFLVAVIALVAGFVAVRQLGSAAAESRKLFSIQERADGLVRTQLDEETSLRGYLISRRTAFLEPYLSQPDPFDEQAADLDRDLAAADLPSGREHLRTMLEAHRKWRSEFAAPLIEDPSGRDISARESYGKLLDDRIRNEAAALRAEIASRNERVEASLESNIDRTVDYSVGFVLIVALSVLYLGLAQRSTQAELTRQHSIAALLQAALGVGWQTIPGTTIGTAYISATTDTDVGGDLFDAWSIDDRYGAIMIADMSGKGIDAVVNTAFCKYSIRALLATHRDPVRVMTEFNRMFAQMVSDPSMFAVVFLGLLDAATGRLTYVSAGHEPAFVRHGPEARPLEIGGPIIGMEADSQYVASNITLKRDDMIVLATDGLTEARDTEGDMLGISGALALLSGASKDPQRLCDDIIAAIRRRGGETVGDDLALLTLRFDGGTGTAVAESVA